MPVLTGLYHVLPELMDDTHFGNFPQDVLALLFAASIHGAVIDAIISDKDVKTANLYGQQNNGPNARRAALLRKVMVALNWYGNGANAASRLFHNVAAGLVASIMANNYQKPAWIHCNRVGSAPEALLNNAMVDAIHGVNLN